MFFVYILRSVDNKFIYKGLTATIERRLQEHFQGKVPSTKHFLPLELVHVEVCQTRKEARALEKFLNPVTVEKL
jgi:predicted GIY-YIG superfamily endonuclease